MIKKNKHFIAKAKYTDTEAKKSNIITVLTLSINKKHTYKKNN